MVTAESPHAMVPYLAAGGALLSEPVVVDQRIFVTTGDGRLVALTLEGAIDREWQFGAPFAASPAVHSGVAFLVDIDGSLIALEVG